MGNLSKLKKYKLLYNDYFNCVNYCLLISILCIL